MTLGHAFLFYSAFMVIPAPDIEDMTLKGAIIDEVRGDILICFLDDFVTDFRIQHLLSFEAAVTNKTFWPRLRTTDGTERRAKIGYIVYKYPNNDTDNTVTRLMAILKRYPRIVAIVGFITGRNNVVQAASFVNAIRMPSFTTASGTIIDEILTEPNHDYMTTITSKRSVQITRTIPSLLDKLEVNIVSIFYDNVRRLEFVKLVQELLSREKRVDVYKDELLHGYPDDSDAERVMNHLVGEDRKDKSLILKKGRVHTIIFLLVGPILQKIIASLAEQREELPQVLFITDSSGCIRVPEFKEAVEKLVSSPHVHMFRLCQTQYNESSTEKYIDNYKLYRRQPNGTIISRSKVIDNWYTVSKNKSRCVVEDAPDEVSGKECQSVGEVCREEIPTSRYNHRIYYTVRKILKSLENITSQEVEDISNRSFNELLFKSSNISRFIKDGFQNDDVLPNDATFLRYSNGSMENDYEVLFNTRGKPPMSGVWTSSGKNEVEFKTFMEEALSIMKNRNNAYLTCSKNCTEGQRKVVNKTFPNCWNCIACTGNTFSDGGLFICEDCKTNVSDREPLWVNDNKTRCDHQARSVNISNTPGKIIWVLASLNFAALTFTIVVYVKYWKSAAIVSSERSLSCVMLAGLLVGNLESMVIASDPTKHTCIMSQILAQLFGMLTVCPLLVKTFKKWLIFHFSLKLGNKIVKYANASATVLQCVILMLPLLTLLLVGLMLENSFTFRFTVKYTEESLEKPVAITKSCGPGNFSLALAGIIYKGCLLGVSSALGWDCRKLPGNYREMMRIFTTSFIALLLIVVYVPAKRNMAGFAQVSLLAGSVAIISLVVNLLIFMPKVYVVLFVSEEKQRQMFSTPRSDNSTNTAGDVKYNPSSNIQSHI